MEEYICKFCGKQCKNANSLRNHERLCKLNPNHDTIKSNFVKYNSDRKNGLVVTWNKGLTKDTDERLKAKGEKLHKRYVNGELTAAFKGKTHTEETKKKISESMSKAQAEGRAYNIGQSRWNNEHSRPEKWLIDVLQNEFNLIEHVDYKTEFPFHRYALDFAWPEKKVCIEIDGTQHSWDERQIARDKMKDALLLQEGWKELRLTWVYICNNSKEAIEQIKDFLCNVY